MHTLRVNGITEPEKCYIHGYAYCKYYRAQFKFTIGEPFSLFFSFFHTRRLFLKDVD